MPGDIRFHTGHHFPLKMVTGQPDPMQKLARVLDVVRLQLTRNPESALYAYRESAVDFCHLTDRLGHRFGSGDDAHLARGAICVLESQIEAENLNSYAAYKLFRWNITESMAVIRQSLAALDGCESLMDQIELPWDALQGSLIGFGIHLAILEKRRPNQDPSSIRNELWLALTEIRNKLAQGKSADSDLHALLGRECGIAPPVLREILTPLVPDCDCCPTMPGQLDLG